jgi:hypothetical protein
MRARLVAMTDRMLGLVERGEIPRFHFDGQTIVLEDYLEVRPELVGQEVELRFDPHDDTARPRVFIENSFVCDTVPLDRVANASRKRRRVSSEASRKALCGI